VSWIWIPEMKHRSFREIDILFRRRVQARKWKKTNSNLHLLVIVDIDDRLFPFPGLDTTPEQNVDLTSYMLNDDTAKLGGKSGYVWAGTAFFCTVVSWIWMICASSLGSRSRTRRCRKRRYQPRRSRSCRPASPDILFRRRVQARKWKKTVIDIHDDE
jgi:hypothetical protein